MNNCKKKPDICCDNNANNQGINTAFIIIVLFILLAIIFAGFSGYNAY